MNTEVDKVFAYPNQMKNVDENNSAQCPLTNIVKIYFNFAYYLGLCPFRFQSDANSTIVLKKSLFQSIICGTLHLFSFVRLFTEIRLPLSELRGQDNITPAHYFVIFGGFLTFAYKFTTLKRFWLNRQEYLNILKVSQENFYHQYKQSNSHALKYLLNPRWIYGFFTVFVALCIANLVTGKYFNNKIWTWPPKLWLQGLLKLAKYTVFLDEYTSTNESSLSLINATIGQVSLFEGFIGFVMSIGLLQRYMLSFFSDLCIFSCALTLWSHAKVFADSLRTENSWGKIYQNFLAMQNISLTINFALGSQVTGFVAESMIYYSFNLNALLTMNNPVRGFETMCFIVLAVGSFGISANVCSQMESIMSFITTNKNRNEVKAQEMALVMHEIVAKDIGIRGSNVFTITYSFIAAVLSNVVTIFIISVQAGEKGI